MSDSEDSDVDLYDFSLVQFVHKKDAGNKLNKLISYLVSGWNLRKSAVDVSLHF